MPALAHSPTTHSLATQSRKKGVHEDSVFGYSFKPPKDWTSIPIQSDESWLVAKFLSKREYSFTGKGSWTYSHKPELMAIAFIEDLSDEEDEDEEGEVEDDGEDGEVSINFNLNYKNYEDYLRRTYSGGGYFIAAEEEGELKGVSVTRLDIKVEKLTRRGPKRINTWIYHLEGVDLAIQVEVLENHYKKLKKTIEGALKSFKEIPREGALPGEQDTSMGRLWVSRSDMDSRSVSERNTMMMDKCEAQHQKAIDSLPEGWKHSKEKDCLLISNADMKYGKRIAEQTGAVVKWLEDSFDYFGPQHYVRTPIIRVCKTSDEQYSYNRGGGNFWGGTDLEFVTSLESIRDWGGEFSWMNGNVASHWFQDRDRELYWAMPEWLQHGLQEFVNNSRAKGSKLKFHQDDWDRDDLRTAVRENRVSGPRALMQMTRTALWESGGTSFWSRRDESSSFVYFLLEGDGAKNKKYREIIPSYLKNLKALLEEDATKEKESEPEGGGSPQTEEEEEEMFRNRRTKLREREEEFLERVFNRTFSGWSTKDFEKLDKAFLKSIS